MTGRAIINARGKPNHQGGGLLWDDHNIWAVFDPTKEEERKRRKGREREYMFSHTLAITHGKKTFDSSLARITARGKIILDADRAESKRSRRERHIKGELCGRARKCCLWERSARQLIVSLPRRAESRFDD